MECTYMALQHLFVFEGSVTLITSMWLAIGVTEGDMALQLSFEVEHFAAVLTYMKWFP